MNNKNNKNNKSRKIMNKINNAKANMNLAENTSNIVSTSSNPSVNN
mgnify:CR=1 FL=1